MERTRGQERRGRGDGKRRVGKRRETREDGVSVQTREGKRGYEREREREREREERERERERREREEREPRRELLNQREDLPIISLRLLCEDVIHATSDVRRQLFL